MNDDIFWIVWKDGGGPACIKHESFENALAEAERLALKNPGASFYVLAAESVSRTTPPVITSFLVAAF